VLDAASLAPKIAFVVGVTPFYLRTANYLLHHVAVQLSVNVFGETAPSLDNK